MAEDIMLKYLTYAYRQTYGESTDPKDTEDSFLGINRSVSPFKTEDLALGQPLTAEAIAEAARLLIEKDENNG